VTARKVDELVAEADELRSRRLFPQAIEKLRKALLLQPSSPDVNFALGISFAQSGQAPQAVKHLRTTLEADPEHAAALSWLASILSSTGRLHEAEQVALKAAHLHPDEPAVHNNLGRIYLDKREPQRALSAFQRAVELSPDIAPILARLGQTLQILGRYGEAAANYRKAMRLMPQDEAIRGMLVRLLMSMGESQEALEILHDATRINPSSFAAQIGFAQALFESGQGRLALETLRRAVKLDPNSAFARGLLGACLSEIGEFEEAVEEFRYAIRLDPSMGTAYYDLVESKTVTEEDAALVEQMMAQLRKTNLPPLDRMSFHFACGKAFDDLGRFREAMEQFDFANRLCHQISFGGSRFDRDLFAGMVDEMISKFPMGGRRDLPEGNPSNRPIFVVGMIRSGTTLVERILASHPEVSAGGEIKFLAAQFDQDHCLGLEQLGASAQIASDYLDLLVEIGDGKRRVTDKMPSNFRAVGPIHALFPNARIVHVRRNPVDTCISIYSHLFHNPPEFCCDRESIVFAYQQYQRLMAHWRQSITTERFFEIEYESLVEDRENVVRALLEFCGLEWNDRCLRHEKTEGQIRTVSKRQARLPIYTKSLHRWKNYEPWLGSFSKLLEE
jgi:Flp pilus assembly protein TadD